MSARYVSCHVAGTVGVALCECGVHDGEGSLNLTAGSQVIKAIRKCEGLNRLVFLACSPENSSTVANFVGCVNTPIHTHTHLQFS